VFVDNPAIAQEIEEVVDGEVLKRSRTLANDLAENIRPYWRLYPALNVPGVELGPIGAGYGITRIRLSEVINRVDPQTLGEGPVERVRMITPMQWWLFEREAPEGGSPSSIENPSIAVQLKASASESLTRQARTSAK
jgi:hypothetical protein